MLAACRRGIRKADRTGQVAVLVNLDQGEAGMLLVVRAQAAIVRAAELSAALQVEWPVARFDVVLAQPPIGCIAGNERRLDAMLLAAFLVPDLVVLDGDLGRH